MRQKLTKPTFSTSSNPHLNLRVVEDNLWEDLAQMKRELQITHYSESVLFLARNVTLIPSPDIDTV